MNCHFHPVQSAWRSCKTCTRSICSECANFDTDKLALCPLCWGVTVTKRRMNSLGRLALYAAVAVVGYFAFEGFVQKFVPGYNTPMFLKLTAAYAILSIFLGWPHVERFKAIHWVKPCPNYIPQAALVNKAQQAQILGFFYGPYSIGKAVYDFITAGRKYRPFG